LWGLALAGAIYLAGGLGDALVQEEKNLTTTDSDRVDELVAQLNAADAAHQVDTELIFVTSGTADFGDADFTATLETVRAAVANIDGVDSVAVPTADSPGLVSESGRAAGISVALALDYPEEVGEELNAAIAAVDAPGFTVVAYGEQTGSAYFDALAEESLVKGEIIGISVALVILVIVFGAFVAAGLPLLVAIVAIIAAIGATAVAGRAFDLSFFVINMITMMGLALGIDYSLLAVQRFREELARGLSVRDAVAVSGNTANRAVFFSGVTVFISLVGLAVVPSTIMVSLGVGAMITAVMAVAAALTLLPAVLALLGHRVNKGRVRRSRPDGRNRFWERTASIVIARPALMAGIGFVILLTLAAPALGMRLTFPGTDSLPEGNDFRVATQVAVDEFGMGQSATIVTIEDAGSVSTQVDALATDMEDSPAFAEVSVTWLESTAYIEARDVYDAADIRAEEAVQQLRDTVIPAALGTSAAKAYVGGEQASTIDFRGLVTNATPWVLLIVLGATFVLLLMAFRSLVVPLVAIGLNLLSTAAAFGLMVAVFQNGWGADLLGLPQVDGIAPWIPLFLFAVLFGLSMDYHVFLVSRIKEAHDSGTPTKAAIAVGLSRTGSLITGAALIMVAVFTGFALGDLADFAQMGFGLAAAIIVDATIVRTLLAPALMAMLGDRNWYLPRWLGWLPQVSIEAPSAPEVAPEPEREPVVVA